MLALFLLGSPGTALAFPNSSIAATAERSTDGGQCIIFVNNVLREVSGGRINLSAWGHGYQRTYAVNGAKLVSISRATRGDVIQVTPAGTADSWKGPEFMPLHTAIIRRNLGGGNFDVIDSNWSHNGKVQRHLLNPSSWAASRGGGIVKIWRFGTVATAKPPAKPKPWTGVGKASFLGGSSLESGQIMRRGQYVASDSGMSALILQEDGNLVLYGGGKARWSTKSAGTGADRVVMQGDGNLVLYAGAKAIWSSKTNGQGKSRLVVQTDGNLVIYKVSGGHTWASGTQGKISTSAFGSDRLTPTSPTLRRGQYLRSSDRRYALVLQGDGNLVLYGPGYHVLWHSNTDGTGTDRLVMQGDGNLVLYAGGKATWSSKTNGRGASNLILQSDGNLVVYKQGGGSTWSSRTNGKI